MYTTANQWPKLTSCIRKSADFVHDFVYIATAINLSVYCSHEAIRPTCNYNKWMTLWAGLDDEWQRWRRNGCALCRVSQTTGKEAAVKPPNRSSEVETDYCNLYFIVQIHATRFLQHILHRVFVVIFVVTLHLTGRWSITKVTRSHIITSTKRSHSHSRTPPSDTPTNQYSSNGLPKMRK